MTHQPLTKAEREKLRANLVPGTWEYNLLADLDAAEAERDELRAALIASGNAVGAALTDRCSSQFLCNVPAEVTLVYKRIAAQRDRAEAERDDYRERLADARQKLIAMEEQAMVDEDGMSMRPFDERLRKVEAERDALKAKLAALVKTATDLREVAFDGPSEPKGAGVHGGREGVFDWKQRIDCESAAAIAAAKGGMS